jgi:LemA protein
MANQLGTLARQLRCRVLHGGHEPRLLILPLEDSRLWSRSDFGRHSLFALRSELLNLTERPLRSASALRSGPYAPFQRLTSLLFVVATGVVLSGCGINTIPTLEERAKASWSEVQNQYQRRAELIPNLVETVKGYANQEREVLTQVIEARAKATQVQVRVDQLTDPEALRKFQEAQAQLSGALGRLIAVSENYPDLKSNQNFLALQSQLEGTENRIAVARRDYIQAVQDYNTETRTFPGRLWAMIYGAKPMATFSTTEENQRPPPVKF